MSLQMLAMPGGKAYMPITKVDAEQRLVYGYASTPAKDYEGDIITLDAIAASVPGYMQFGNIREMHTMSAVGVAKDATMDDKGLYLCAKIVDDAAWKKVQEGVYKGFSIGGNATSRDPRDKHIITGLDLIEISVVDRPANPEALIDFFKATKPPETKSMAKPEPTIDQMRVALSKAVEELSEEEVAKAFAAADLQVQPAIVDSAEPVEKVQDVQPEPAPAPAVTPAPIVKPHEAVAKRLLEAEDKDGFAKAAASAMEMNEAQINNLLRMNTVSLGRWLANNEGLLAKCVPLLDNSYNCATKIAAVLAKPDPGQAGAAMAKAVAALAAEPDPVIKGIYGTQEEAGYADTGFLPDKKLRFPLKRDGVYSERRIRAAWDHINKAVNQTPYSAEDLALIKGNVIAAWKDAISEDGPVPAIKDPNPKTEKTVIQNLNEMQPDAKGSIRKGLMAACSAIQLLNQLNYLTDSIEAEAALEEDGSAMPDRFKAMLAMLADAVKGLLNEEVDELLSNEDTDIDYPVYIAYAKEAESLLKRLAPSKGSGDLLLKAIGDRTGDAGYTNLVKFCEDVLAKAESVTQTQGWPGDLPNTTGENCDWGTLIVNKMGENDDWVGKAQDIHDAACAKGAACQKSANKDTAPDDVDGKNPPPPAAGAADGSDDSNAADGKDSKNKAAKPASEPAPAAVAAQPDPAPQPVAKAVEPAPAAPAAPVFDADALMKGIGKLIDDKLAPVQAGVEEMKAARRNPAPPGRTPAQAIDKADDVDPAISKGPAVDPEKPETVLKALRQQPRFVNNPNG